MLSEIEVRDVVKSFGKVKALNDLTFFSKKGVNIILGPNGAGKSTLLKCIDGQYKIDSGFINVAGKDPYRNDSLRNRLSLLTDNYALYDHLSVIDNLKFFGRLYGLGKTEIVERSTKSLKALDASEYLNSRVYTLSRGTKQKIAFCRAILNDPELLLLDEPTAFLDAGSAGAVRELIKDYAEQGRTIIFVTQKIDEVTRFNARVAVMSRGKIVKDTDTSGIYSYALKGAVVNIRLAKPINAESLKRLRGFLKANGKNATFIKIRTESYRDINGAVKYLAEHGAYVVSVDYVEPLIEKLSRGVGR